MAAAAATPLKPLPIPGVKRTHEQFASANQQLGHQLGETRIHLTKNLKELTERVLTQLLTTSPAPAVDVENPRSVKNFFRERFCDVFRQKNLEFLSSASTPPLPNSKSIALRTVCYLYSPPTHGEPKGFFDYRDPFPEVDFLAALGGFASKAQVKYLRAQICTTKPYRDYTAENLDWIAWFHNAHFIRAWNQMLLVVGPERLEVRPWNYFDMILKYAELPEVKPKSNPEKNVASGSGSGSGDKKFREQPSAAEVYKASKLSSSAEEKYACLDTLEDLTLL